MRFDNQSALISGAASGLGRAYALALAERGAKVMLMDCMPLEATEVQSLLQALETTGASYRYWSVDVGSPDAIEAWAAEFAAAGSGVDLLINNAGVHTHSSFEHQSITDIRRQLQVDLLGSIALTHALWPGMMNRGYGRIVMSTGVSGLYGDLHQSAFACAKMALIGLVNGLAAEGLARNVMVNSLCPLAHTAMTDAHLAPQVKSLFSKEIVTAAMLFLLSGQAPGGRHLLAGGGSVSELCIAEHRYCYFESELRTPEVIAAHWADIDNAWPIQKHANGEDQIFAFAKRAAHEQGIRLD
ncbi:SDR family NAD(P)-dependent oxidoreductase [Shewanella litorisediminis]|uniref:SDR family NAD(P)-dependent oxidoreductase n=1 Tax=Shewanella litorisediminis TaxID=1173586 RepID=A0ABX7G737_9GAMM|nr:SDR family NAD(P)-dependent oxidoreductase [Shewanella litorisediminis]MCL2916739.1 SDR family NAD(P)-dependent oxidoreductase [Shewanella litorisediminis]QRH03091.1 SDR family NAD(P)-dependent oxidoreductase [Shewanella litorisediminis]